MNDQTAVQNYLTESQEKINDLVEKFEDIEVLESLVEEMQYFNRQIFLSVYFFCFQHSKKYIM